MTNCEVCGYGPKACLCLSCPWCDHPTAWKLTRSGSHCEECDRVEVTRRDFITAEGEYIKGAKHD